MNQHAKKFAQLGYRLVPLRDNSKRPSISEWTKRASNDLWLKEPERQNWGIMGQVIPDSDGSEQLVIIDVDVKGESKGSEQLAGLIDKYGKPPRTYMVRTWSGGFHLYFKAPASIPSFNGTVAGCPSIDIIGPTRQVVLPGSHVVQGDKEGSYVEMTEHELFAPVEEMASIAEWFGGDVVSLLADRTSKQYAAPAKIVVGNNSHSEVLSRTAYVNARYGLTGQELVDHVYREMSERKDLGHYDGPLEKEWIAGLAEWVTNRWVIHDITDMSLAEYLARSYRDDLRYVPGHGFYVWNGSTWEYTPNDARVYKLMGTLKNSLMLDKAEIESTHLTHEEKEARDKGGGAKPTDDHEENEKRLVKTLDRMIKRYSEEPSQRRITATIKRHSIDNPEDMFGFEVSINDLDANKDLLTVANGTLEFGEDGSVKFRESRRDDLLTQSIDVDYSKDADCPLFKTFISQIIARPLREDQRDVLLSNSAPDDEAIEWLQMWFGYCLTGHTSEAIFTVFYGAGRNGKSVLVNTIQHVMGSLSVDKGHGLFDVRVQGNKDLDKKDLIGKRLLTITEGTDYHLDESEIKSHLGGDYIKGRALYKDSLHFRPTHKIIMTSNSKPRIKDPGPAIWDKLVLVEFPLYLQDHERDRTLQEKLYAEAPGILNWMIEGQCKWRKKRNEGHSLFGMRTDKMKRDAAEYEGEQVPIKMFMAELFEVSQSGRELGPEVYDMYRSWELERGTPETFLPSARSFYSVLNQLQFPTKRGTGNKMYIYGAKRREPQQGNIRAFPGPLESEI